MTPPIRTRPDGTKYPIIIIHRRRKWRGPLIVTTSVGIVIAAGGSGATTATAELGATRLPTSTTTKAKARDVKAQSALRRVVRDGLRIERQVSALTDDCAAQSSGDVEEFLRENPCESMLRVHLEIHDDDDDTALAAIAWVDMPNSESAEELHDLVENPDNEGSLELDWTQEDAGSGDVHPRKEHVATARDDTVVVIAKVEPLDPSSRTDWSDIADQMLL